MSSKIPENPDEEQGGHVGIGRERGWGRLVLLPYCMCIGLVVLGRVIGAGLGQFYCCVGRN
ncbi:hypothetical protein KY289_016801 [Solanum tuberosum]|nr:hypothetical protein KY289_016801 [Solanum tuberosum]